MEVLALGERMGTLTWQELDDLYYQKYPDEWKNEPLYLDYEWAHDIYDGKGDRHLRLVQDNENITDSYIERANRKVWEVGRTYHVLRKFEVIGQLKLVQIECTEKRQWFKPIKQAVWLIFEKVT